MVGTRWESSNRPLFVRTVWKDGHHHVVLRKDEEVGVQIPRSGRKNPASGRSGKKKAPPSAESSNSFKVPSVKLLLENLRSFKNEARGRRCKTEQRNFVKSALTVDVVPSDSVRYNDINKQVSFKNEKRRSFRFTPKSSSVEVSHFYYKNDTSIPTPPPFSYDNYCLDQFNNSLSERVLIWLDLAIQNEKRFKSDDLKKRVVTAQACAMVTRNKPKLEKVNDVKIEETKKTVGNEVATDPLVTSRMECDHVDAVSAGNTLKMRAATAKRQLHIFLPHLPKKCSDSGSFLSSKSNSLLLNNKL